MVTNYTGGGTGQFCSLDLTTGAATLLEDTVSLNAEMEIACEAGIGGGEPGVAYCFGDGSGTACPCANNNDGSIGGAGCDNGVFASG